MKKLLILGILTISTMFMFSCQDNESVKETEQAKEWTSDRQGDVVHVNNGTQDFFMTYMMYSMLMNNGGYSNIQNHYYNNSQAYKEQSNLKKQYSSSKPIAMKTEPKQSFVNNNTKQSVTSKAKVVTPGIKYTKPDVVSKPIIKKTIAYKTSIAPTRTIKYTSSSYKTPSKSSSSSWSSSQSSGYRSSSSSYRSSSRR